MNGFDNQKVLGKEVEQIVKRHLRSRGHLIEDVSEDEKFQKNDIDFIVRSKDGANCIKLEVKRDDDISKTGNFFFELESENENGYVGKGWASYTKANYICFYDCGNGKGYIIDWDALKPILFTTGQTKYFYDKLDRKLRKAVLIRKSRLLKMGLIVYKWEDK